MTRQEVINTVKTKLEIMIDKKEVGYLQINLGVEGNVVIHEHFVNAPVKIVKDN